jgi:hypothetical protein
MKLVSIVSKCNVSKMASVQEVSNQQTAFSKNISNKEKTKLPQMLIGPPPTDNTITDRTRRFLVTGSVHDLPRSGRPSVSADVVGRFQELFTQRPSKCTQRSSSELGFPRATVHKYCLKFEVRCVQCSNSVRAETSWQFFPRAKKTKYFGGSKPRINPIFFSVYI